jgi:hypothetical protein
MLCSLLRAIKVFFVGNALFSSQAVVHLDSNRSMVGITYHLEHAGLHLENTVTLIHDLRYASCFKEKVHTAVSDNYLYLSPEVKRVLRRGQRKQVVVRGSPVSTCLPCPSPTVALTAAPTPAPTAAPTVAPLSTIEEKRTDFPSKDRDDAVSPLNEMQSPSSNRPLVNHTTLSRRPVPTPLLHQLHVVPIFVRTQQQNESRARRVLSGGNTLTRTKHRILHVIVGEGKGVGAGDEDSDSEEE